MRSQKMTPSHRPLTLLLFILLVITSLFISQAHSSTGDSSKLFKACVSYCVAEDKAAALDKIYDLPVFPIINGPDGKPLDAAQREAQQEKRKREHEKLVEQFNRITLHHGKDVSPPHATTTQDNVPLLWTLLDECKYHCMWQIENFRKEELGKEKPHKYHGKWPFKRFLYFQEFFSSLFSLLNIVPHVWFLYQVKDLVKELDLLKEKRRREDGQDESQQHAEDQEAASLRKRKAQQKDSNSSSAFHFDASLESDSDITTQKWLLSVWKGYAFASMNAWIWSFVFHGRDVLVTERLDYFSAFMTILYGTYATFVSTVYPKKPHTISLSIFAVTALFYLRHVYYMHFVSFDYGYNMTVNIVLSSMFTLMWISFAYRMWGKHRSAWKFVFASVMLILASALEIFDFPPLFDLVDAHAIWHLATPPLAGVFYQGILAMVVRKDYPHVEMQRLGITKVE